MVYSNVLNVSCLDRYLEYAIIQLAVDISYFAANARISSYSSMMHYYEIHPPLYVIVQKLFIDCNGSHDHYKFNNNHNNAHDGPE